MIARTHAAALTALLATAGCAAVPQQAQWVEARPLQVGAGGEVSAVDRYYSGSVAAIERRDYAAALELLQLARARAPDDVRVFNAFGVVYDKLGRFDLSARYYAQAAALEPSSTIVAANVAYSAILERRIAQPVEGVQLARADGDLTRIAQPDFSEPVPVVRPIVEAARALVIAASGPPARIETARARPAGASPRAMAQPDFSEPVSGPKPVARPPALAPIVSAAPLIIASNVRVEPASSRPPTGSPRPMRQPTFADTPASESISPQPAAPRHVLYRAVVSPGGTLLVSGPPVRIDHGGRPAPAAPRAMAQPTFAAAPELPSAAGRSVRLVQKAPVLRLAAAQPSSPRVVRLASTTAAPRRLPLLTGNTLLVINASGRQAGGGAVVTRLAHLGWSVRRSAQAGRAQSQTSIVYPSRNASVAYALARTLPYKVRLVNCAARCDRMSLVVGADALAWRKGQRTGSMVRAKAA